MKKVWANVNSIYQIYPRSFKDTNGDGVGDLRGIIEKIPYLKGSDNSLGVDAIWLSPVFQSPQVDCGYDVSDYRQIDQLFGTMEEMDELVKVAHENELKVMLDFVPNHTSVQHHWFEKSRRREPGFEDFYIWRDAKEDGSLPNNWLSMAGGSVWQWDDVRGAYYLHTHDKSQADLNWQNPAVREAIYDDMRFWLDKGIDGYRIDAVWTMSKHPEFKDNPRNPHYFKDDQDYGSFINRNSKDGPELFTYLKEMSDVLKEYDERFLVFEYYPDSQLHDTMYRFIEMQHINPSVASTFFFEPMELQWWSRKYQERIDAMMGAIQHSSRPVVVLGNHDQSRIASKYGIAQARELAVITLALPGIPTIYYGEEINMTDQHYDPEYLKDGIVGAHTSYDGRDPARSPMRWNTFEKNAGFSDADKTWLPVGEDVEGSNVNSQESDPNSTLNLYKKLLRLRKERPVFRAGTYQPLLPTEDEIMSFQVVDQMDTIFCFANFSDREETRTLPVGGSTLVSTTGRQAGSRVEGTITLAPFEAVLIEADRRS